MSAHDPSHGNTPHTHGHEPCDCGHGNEHAHAHGKAGDECAGGGECGGCDGHEHHHHHGHAVAALDRQFFVWVSAAVLALWGGVMLWYFASGLIVHYLSGTGAFRIQCLIAGLALCVLAAFTLLRSREEAAAGDCSHEGECCAHGHGEETEHDAHGDHHHHHHHHHDHAHGSAGGWSSKVVAFFILVVPLSAAALYSPHGYSDEFKRLKVESAITSNTLRGGGIDLRERAEKAKPVPGANVSAAAATKTGSDPLAFDVAELERLSGGRTAEGNIPLQLVELFYMPAQTPDVRDVVATQTIETVGQAIRDKDNPKRFRLFRLMVTCCSADARPISVPVEFEGAMPEWREMAWYKVIGTVEYREENGAQTAVFKAKELRPDKAPRNQLMF